MEISEHYTAVPQRVRDGNISGYCPQRLSQSEDALMENIVMTCIKNLREWHPEIYLCYVLHKCISERQFENIHYFI